ncbi:MAG: response regulator [Alphaproteobacteria bacterium]|nr:response regulator [Alphaproteobacteria bacterium]
MAVQGPLVILVVDDDPFVRESTATILGALSYDVVDAGSGDDAVALARAGRAIDVALVDFHMPGGLDGLETVRALRQIRPDLPFVLVTGDHAETIRFDGDLAGGVALGKPYRMADLRNTLQRLLAAG